MVIDTSDCFPQPGDRIEAAEDGRVESLRAAERLGRPAVKAWNAALAGTSQTRGVPAAPPGRSALPVAADSGEARHVGMRLVDESGFDPYDAGAPADSWRRQPMTPAYCTEPSPRDPEQALAAADRSAAPRHRDRRTSRFATLTSAPTPEEAVEPDRRPHG
ncbi:hypothetical protein [Streptomyces sp. SCL15-4]|uniref:hypothetical protein n=1 Tax=Streptomyces sp. SCL15-4 TaxID=2967221 RepID=UPI0029663CA5|nr:hypothetical protein [Streptomyces sp. SCL15-4]